MVLVVIKTNYGEANKMHEAASNLGFF